jgi:hypothetical protein
MSTGVQKVDIIIRLKRQDFLNPRGNGFFTKLIAELVEGCFAGVCLVSLLSGENERNPRKPPWKYRSAIEKSAAHL